MSAASYVVITSGVGARLAEHGIDLRPGENLVFRAEHWRRVRANSARLDAAADAMRVVAKSAPREGIGEAAADAADEAWRRMAQPWRLAGVRDGDDVRDPDDGLASATRTGGVR